MNVQVPLLWPDGWTLTVLPGNNILYGVLYVTSRKGVNERFFLMNWIVQRRGSHCVMMSARVSLN